MIKLLRILLLVVSAWVFIHCLWVTYDGLKPFTGKADVAVVLGTTMEDDGTLSPWLKGRVDEALQLYRNRQVKTIMVSGGIEADNNQPEGTRMKEYLVRNGVDSNAIIIDNHGDNTYFTAKNFADLNSKENYKSAVMVSSFYHITRTKYIVRKFGFQNVQGDFSRAFFFKDIFGLGREFVAFYKYLLVY